MVYCSVSMVDAGIAHAGSVNAFTCAVVAGFCVTLNAPIMTTSGPNRCTRSFQSSSACCAKPSAKSASVNTRLCISSTRSPVPP